MHGQPLWEQMTKSFAKDDKIRFAGAVHLEHDHVIDEQSFEMSATNFRPKKFTSLRDSVFIHRRRNSLNTSMNENFGENCF